VVLPRASEKEVFLAAFPFAQAPIDIGKAIHVDLQGFKKQTMLCARCGAPHSLSRY
jgi:hypothetical protein